jgi:predicted Zn-dependent peptidase
MLSRSQRFKAAASRSRGAALLALVLAAALVAVTAPASYAAKAAPAKAGRAPAAASAPARTGLESVERQVKDFTLPNGLEFIVVERHQAPVFSYMTVVGSGAANDQIGTTGLAHMMEHMAFKGTPIVGTKDYEKEKPLLDGEESAWMALLNERRKGVRADSSKLRSLEQAFKAAEESAREPVVSNEFSKVIEQAGAQDANAFTADDLTAYFYSIPSNRLELWALMEGSRMTYPVFREFYKEREVVYEERRLRVESSPVGRLFDEFIHAAFAAHPYGFGGIGYPSDLKTFSRTQGDEYFKKNYVAKNMVVAVVGDVTVADVQAYAQKYFGELSDAPKPPPVDTVEPEQKAERRVILEDPAQPYVAIGWHIPAASDPSYPAYRAMSNLLGGGDFARLNKVLVKEKKILTQLFVTTGLPGERYPNLFLIFGVPAAGQDPLKVEQEIYSVLDEIQKSKPFTAEELDGYKIRVKSEKIATVDANSDLASSLAQAQILYGDWREFFREQERIQSLKVSDLMDAMRRSLVKSNRTVGVIINPSAQAANAGGK